MISDAYGDPYPVGLKHLARCPVDLDLNMVRAGAVRHPRAWAAGGYHEIQAPRCRYRLIDRQALAELLGGGLLFARAVGGASPGGWTLALWAFLLVQSVYFLAGGVRVRTAVRTRRDPFEEAYGRALALLEGREG